MIVAGMFDPFRKALELWRCRRVLVRRYSDRRHGEERECNIDGKTSAPRSVSFVSLRRDLSE